MRVRVQAARLSEVSGSVARKRLASRFVLNVSLPHLVEPGVEQLARYYGTTQRRPSRFAGISPLANQFVGETGADSDPGGDLTHRVDARRSEVNEPVVEREFCGYGTRPSLDRIRVPFSRCRRERR